MKEKQFTAIVAMAQNSAIGKNNDLLWYISEDLKRFKALTSGHTVIMGYKTFLSLPVRPFPNRKNIVIVDDKNIHLEGCTMAYSLEEAVFHADQDRENFIVGGASIYAQFLPLCQKMYITKVLKDFEADVFFPSFSDQEWILIEETAMQKDEKSGLQYVYQLHQRK